VNPRKLNRPSFLTETPNISGNNRELLFYSIYRYQADFMSNPSAAASAGGRPRREAAASSRRLFDLAKEPVSRRGAAAKAPPSSKSVAVARVSPSAAVSPFDRYPPPRQDPELSGEGSVHEERPSEDDEDAHAEQGGAGQVAHGQECPPPASPVVEVLSALVDQQRAAIVAIRSVSLSAQKEIEALSHPDSNSGGSASAAVIPTLSEEAMSRIGALQDALKINEARLAVAVEEEEKLVAQASGGSHMRAPVPHRVPASSAPKRNGKPVFKSRYSGYSPDGPMDAVVQRFGNPTEAALAAHLEREKSYWRRERKHPSAYDEEEQAAFRSGRWMGPENRSPEQYTGKPLSKHLYERDGFCVDDSDASITASSQGTTDDCTCTTASNAADSSESESEQQCRLDVIKLSLARSAAKTDGNSDIFRLSASGKQLHALRATDIRVKRRNRRSHIVDLILNVWLRCDPANLQVEHVAELLRQLRLLPPEEAISIFYILVKRFKPLSTSFFKFLYRCIIGYQPRLKRSFGHAYRSVQAKQKKTSKTLLKQPKPTVRAPVLKDITDIAHVVGQFYNDYRAYQRDHKGVHHKSLFQCLSPDQAATFSAMTLVSEDELDAMTDEQVLEQWRTTFGWKSSAAVLQAISQVKFTGDYLSPAIWADFHRRFLLVLNQAPAAHQPPAPEIARLFIFACPSRLLVKDVMAYKPKELSKALSLVLERLNDSGFLRSAADIHRSNPADAAPAARSRQAPAPNARSGLFAPRAPNGQSTSAPPQRHQPRDGVVPHFNDAAEGGAYVRQHRVPEAGGAAQPAVPTRRPAAPTCKRCKREGHTEDACISKHDVNNVLLPVQEPAVYEARRAAAVRAAAARIAAVNAVEDQHSTASSDIDADAHAFLHDNYDTYSAEDNDPDHSDTAINNVCQLADLSSEDFSSRSTSPAFVDILERTHETNSSFTTDSGFYGFPSSRMLTLDETDPLPPRSPRYHRFVAWMREDWGWNGNNLMVDRKDKRLCDDFLLSPAALVGVEPNPQSAQPPVTAEQPQTFTPIPPIRAIDKDVPAVPLTEQGVEKNPGPTGPHHKPKFVRPPLRITRRWEMLAFILLQQFVAPHAASVSALSAPTSPVPWHVATSVGTFVFAFILIVLYRSAPPTKSQPIADPDASSSSTDSCDNMPASPTTNPSTVSSNPIVRRRWGMSLFIVAVFLCLTPAQARTVNTRLLSQHTAHDTSPPSLSPEAADVLAAFALAFLGWWTNTYHAQIANTASPWPVIDVSLTAETNHQVLPPPTAVRTLNPEAPAFASSVPSHPVILLDDPAHGYTVGRDTEASARARRYATRARRAPRSATFQRARTPATEPLSPAQLRAEVVLDLIRSTPCREAIGDGSARDVLEPSALSLTFWTLGLHPAQHVPAVPLCQMGIVLCA